MLELTGRQERIANFLRKLADNPPQCVLLEGGETGEREQAALFWAALLNCESVDKPCGACPSCRQVQEKVLRDLIFLDGREGTIKIDDVREVRRVMGEPPRGDGYRVIVLFEGQELTVEAANSLLKYMEEPKPRNVFVLTAPQRERLLPTLVSRSWVMTLAWPDTAAPTVPPVPEDGSAPEDPSDWAAAFVNFIETGRGWFDRTGAKGRVDKHLAERVVVEIQRGLAQALATQPQTDTARYFARRMQPPVLRRVDLALDQAKQALDYRTNPALVLDWLAVTVHGWLH